MTSVDYLFILSTNIESISMYEMMWCQAPATMLAIVAAL
jgi:hypothetical protein